ncbi:MAG: type II toxin-antitoxin system Phd/YefM family antitoxin [Gammaproteobacteria bacterium]|nr:type II toxin-antitoxin system Phd/YefM family antitoxin [Gammaproteobacteria bacterium]
MRTLNASDAKRKFGDVLLKAQKEPIKINKNGKPVAVVVSIDEYDQMMHSKEKQLIIEVQKGMKDVELRKVSSADSVFKKLHNRLNA